MGSIPAVLASWQASVISLRMSTLSRAIDSLELGLHRIQEIDRWNIMGSIPAVLASRQASVISLWMSTLSRAIASPTPTKRSTARLTAWPTRSSADRVRSERIGFSLALTSVVICTAKQYGNILTLYTTDSLYAIHATVSTDGKYKMQSVKLATYKVQNKMWKLKFLLNQLLKTDVVYNVNENVKRVE